jgi:hypothetical protein
MNKIINRNQVKGYDFLEYTMSQDGTGIYWELFDIESETQEPDLWGGPFSNEDDAHYDMMVEIAKGY